jgi:hypothetical protein
MLQLTYCWVLIYGRGIIIGTLDYAKDIVYDDDDQINVANIISWGKRREIFINVLGRS